MKPCPPLSAEELFILVGFLSATPSALKGFLSLTGWTDFALPRGGGGEFNNVDRIVGTSGLLEILGYSVHKMVLPFPTLQITLLSEAPVPPLSDKHGYAVCLPGCGEVKIRSNALQTRKELSNLRSDSCSWQSSFQLVWIMESQWDTLKIICHLPSSGISRPSSLIIALEPDCPNLLDLWFSGVAAH